MTKSHKPFSRAAQSFIEADSSENRQEWLLSEWKRKQSECRLQHLQHISTSTAVCRLRRKEWCCLNRQRTGIGRFKACMYNWKLADTASRDCGEPKTAEHLVEVRPIHQLVEDWNTLA